MNNGNKAPSPRMPETPRITDVQQLLPMAREMVARKPADMYEGVEVQKGQKVLFINDTTADQLVVESLSTAIRERGADVTIINLEGFVGLKDAADMVDNMFSNNWYPSWVWEAAKDTDILLLTAFLKVAHTPIPKLPNNPFVNNLEMTADLMVSDYEKFPVEIRDTIDEVAWEKLVNCSQVKWTDLEGTEILFNPSPQEWQQTTKRFMERTGLPYHHGHLMLPAPSQSMNGVFVTSSVTFGGPIPRLTLTIEEGKVVRAEGGGKFGERLTESFEKYATLHKSKCPGPGVNWLTTMGICTHPKAQRSPSFDELTASARIYAWTFGHRRSGVIHSSIGEGMISSTHKVIRHLNTYFNTIVTDKGTVIENGHLTALDDPRVRQVASKYGDPDQLLTESWIPAVSGVNAP